MEDFYEEFESEIVFPDSSPMTAYFFDRYQEQNLVNKENESLRLIANHNTLEGYKTEIVNVELNKIDGGLTATYKMYLPNKVSPYRDSLNLSKEIRISKAKWLYLKRMIKNSCFWGKSSHHPKEFNILCDWCCHSILEIKDPSKQNFLNREYHYIDRRCSRNDLEHNLIKDEILSIANVAKRSRSSKIIK